MIGNSIVLANEPPKLSVTGFCGSSGMRPWMSVELEPSSRYWKTRNRSWWPVSTIASCSAIAASVAVVHGHTAIARGGFEYQGQKCSAASRIYVPKSLWPEVKDRVVAMMRDIRMGDVADFRTFMGAVIDRKSFDKISGYLEDARRNATIIEGGTASDEVGYFVKPTLVQAPEPGYRLMCEEIFGPVAVLHAFDTEAEAVAMANATDYGLAASVWTSNTMIWYSRSFIKWGMWRCTPPARRPSRAAVPASAWQWYAVWRAHMGEKYGWKARATTKSTLPAAPST